MNKTSVSFLLMGLICGLSLGVSVTAKAQEKNFSGVLPFTTPAGYVGFFNQNNGEVFIYDNNIAQCTFKGKLSELGEKIEKVQLDKKTIRMELDSIKEETKEQK